MLIVGLAPGRRGIDAAVRCRRVARSFRPVCGRSSRVLVLKALPSMGSQRGGFCCKRGRGQF